MKILSPRVTRTVRACALGPVDCVTFVALAAAGGNPPPTRPPAHSDATKIPARRRSMWWRSAAAAVTHVVRGSAGRGRGTQRYPFRPLRARPCYRRVSRTCLAI